MQPFGCGAQAPVVSVTVDEDVRCSAGVPGGLPLPTRVTLFVSGNDSPHANRLCMSRM